MSIYKVCPGCEMPFLADRPNQKTCSGTCRKRVLRQFDKTKKIRLALTKEQIETLIDAVRIYEKSEGSGFETATVIAALKGSIESNSQG